MTVKLKHYSPSPATFIAEWHVLDAKDRPLGRLASDVAQYLMGKLKPGYVPHLLCGDFVVVINAKHIKVTGGKRSLKTYVRHSGRPGGRKETPFEVVLADHPDRIIKHAVKGMLPKNKLTEPMLKRLKVYPEGEHPHEAQVASPAKIKEQKHIQIPKVSDSANNGNTNDAKEEKAN